MTRSEEENDQTDKQADETTKACCAQEKRES